MTEFVWFIRKSRQYTRPMPWWQFYPAAVFHAWPRFWALRKVDRIREEANR